ncbi:hypothetical protein [Streptomyces nigrescens]|nr:hypothetical protein [Streptomyces nigrescens]
MEPEPAGRGECAAHGEQCNWGIASGEFTPTDVDELSTLVLALGDGS